VEVLDVVTPEMNECVREMEKDEGNGGGIASIKPP
jgi:hypothetical protein